mmetsp:Transcript_57572/g.160325  ORF Transcript_57572/g.160325 Transcript_57572/m.160325 type:complete len:170 (+) Transcript_57572:83-592(+)
MTRVTHARPISDRSMLVWEGSGTRADSSRAGLPDRRSAHAGPTCSSVIDVEVAPPPSAWGGLPDLCRRWVTMAFVPGRMSILPEFLLAAAVVALLVLRFNVTAFEDRLGSRRAVDTIKELTGCAYVTLALVLTQIRTLRLERKRRLDPGAEEFAPTAAQWYLGFLSLCM